MKYVVILSGGLDSTTLLYYIKGAFPESEQIALSFNYGQRHVKELECAKATCKALGVKHKVVDISSINELLQGSALTSDMPVPDGHYEAENMRQTVVPNRNAILLDLAVGYAVSIGASVVAYGAHEGDKIVYPDCRPEFVEAMNAVSLISNWTPVRIIAPFIHMSKGDIVVEGFRLGVNFSNTWTCYKGLSEPCQTCGACTERRLAFEFAGVKDPLVKIDY